MYDQMLKEIQEKFDKINNLLIDKKKEILEIQAELYKIQGEYRILHKLSEMRNAKGGAGPEAPGAFTGAKKEIEQDKEKQIE